MLRALKSVIDGETIALPQNQTSVTSWQGSPRHVPQLESFSNFPAQVWQPMRHDMQHKLAGICRYKHGIPFHPADQRLQIRRQAQI